MNNKIIIKKLLSKLINYKKDLFLILASLSVSTILNLCIPLLNKRIMDNGFVEENYFLLVRLVIIVFVIWLIDAFISNFQEKKRIKIASKIQFDFTESAYKHLMRLKIQFLNNANLAEIINNINVDINKMTSITDGGTLFIVTQIFNIVGGIIGLFIINHSLTLIVLVFIPLKFIIAKYFALKVRKLMGCYIDKNNRYVKWFGDSLGGIKEIRMFNILKYKDIEFKRKQTEVLKEQQKLDMVNQWNLNSDMVLVQFLIMILYIFGAKMVFDMQMTIGGVFAFITYSTYVTTPISSILNIGYVLAGILPSAERYYKFMNLEEEYEGEQSCIPYLGEISFCNVSFTYDGYKKILNNLNTIIPKASKVAIVGLNGAGKSTFMNLLMRMHNVSQGKILLNGKNINEYSLENYRSLIAFVSQDIYLFNDTIENNIKLYKEVNKKNIDNAIADSGLTEYIKKNSLQFIVGNNGSNLSGGEKQKVALARALVHDKPFFIFDEFTSNIDNVSEMKINDLIRNRLTNKTVIIATHRTAILQNVDFIILLSEGKAMIAGTFKELEKNSTLFNDIINFNDISDKN